MNIFQIVCLLFWKFGKLKNRLSVCIYSFQIEIPAVFGSFFSYRPQTKVYDQVKNKLKLGYEYRGAHSLKNIEEPVRVYRVLMEPGAAGKLIGEEKLMPIQKKAHTVRIPEVK